MVRFGNWELPHVLDAQIEKSRVEIERPIPGRCVAYRADQTTRGRAVRVSGEIRADSMSEVAFWIELLRRLADDTERLFDLEEGETAAFNAKLVDPSYELRAGDWFNTGGSYVPYSVSLVEVA